MISGFVKWLMRILLTNSRIRTRVIPRNRVMCLLFVTAHPEWGKTSQAVMRGNLENIAAFSV